MTAAAMPQEAVVVLPADGTSPSAARRYVRGFLGDRGLWSLADDALLLVTELVTNAVRYGAPGVTLRLHTGSRGVGVAVEDRGPLLPQLIDRQSGAVLEHGRGLLLVASLSTAWGVTLAEPPPGKTVWCELGAVS